MSHSTRTSIEVQFAEPESKYFVQSGSLDEWYCKVCTPPKKGEVEYMSLKMAQDHERQSGHARKVGESERLKWLGIDGDMEGWEKGDDIVLSKEEMKMRESQVRVDLVRDLVPFWIRGVEAAERGEVLRLEAFLAELEGTESEWGLSGGSWEGWGRADVPEEKRRRRKQGRRKNGYEFVEDVARQEAANDERRRQMHRFFQMPTHQKLEKIRALTSLRQCDRENK